MGSRFGGVSPAQTYATKVRWLVGCLVSIIIVLAAAFIIVAQNSNKDKGEAVATEQPSAQVPAPGKADVLVAIARIEEGTQLKDVMFTAVMMDDSQVPPGGLRKKDLPFVLDKFAARLVSPNVPVVMEDITDKRSFSSLNIPAGYRAVTITVDRRSGVEGFARPDSRVDVLWSYVKDGRQQIATIVRFTKILSVAGMTANNPNAPAANDQGATTVTLLVTEKDAKKIELARTMGTLSLSLVGGDEVDQPKVDPDPVDINKVLDIPDEKVTPKEESADGIMYSTDPKTGKQIRYVLKNKRWVLDKEF